jgi:hypothetical protein
VTPHRASNGRGTLLLDRVFPGVGRIRRAAGTTDRRVFNAINRMLDECYAAGLAGPLEAIRDGVLKPLIAYGAWKASGVAGLPDASALRPLKEAWLDWVRKTPNASTKAQRRYVWSRLETVVPDGATLLALPNAIRRLRDDLADQAPWFNRIQAATLAFLRDELGKRHAAYLGVADVPGLTEVKVRRPAPTPLQLIEIREQLPAAAAAIWWSMATTGMGPEELDGVWIADGLGVEIHGKKRSARHRVVPDLGGTMRRNMGWTRCRAALKGLKRTPYDARRGFIHLMEEAGITRTRRRMYAGHAAGDVTAGYETADLREYLVADRARLLARLATAEELYQAKRREGLKRA